MGKTHCVLNAFKKAYGDRFSSSDCCSCSCNACMWAKAKCKPVRKTRSRKARRVGERLHFDLFYSPEYSRDRKKYMLVVVDEYSSYVIIRGLEKKSELAVAMIEIIAKIETHTSGLVDSIEGKNSIVSIRCDTRRRISYLRC